MKERPSIKQRFKNFKEKVRFGEPHTLELNINPDALELFLEAGRGYAYYELKLELVAKKGDSYQNDIGEPMRILNDVIRLRITTHSKNRRPIQHEFLEKVNAFEEFRRRGVNIISQESHETAQDALARPRRETGIPYPIIPASTQ
jgi:hypothetical protein